MLAEVLENFSVLLEARIQPGHVAASSLSVATSLASDISQGYRPITTESIFPCLTRSVTFSRLPPQPQHAPPPPHLFRPG